jgi:hypothetical protein
MSIERFHTEPFALVTHSMSIEAFPSQRSTDMLTSLILSSLISVTGAPPIALSTCEVSTPVIQQDGDGSATTTGLFALHVRFSDADRQTISRVTFRLNDGTTISDAGTFSPGITINHTLALDSTEATSCAVTAVEFKDGSMWHVQ